MSSISKEILNSLRELVLETLSEIQRRVIVEGVSRKLVSEIEITGPDTTAISEYLQPDFTRLFSKIENEIITKQSFEVFKSSLQADPIFASYLGKLVGTRLMSRRLEAQEIYGKAVWDQLTKNSGQVLDFYEDIFQATCQKIFNLLSSEKIQIKFIAVLEHFDPGVESVELETNLKIQCLKPQEIAKMWNRYSWFRDYYPFYSARFSTPIEQVKGIVELYKGVDKVVGELPQEPDPASSPSEEVRIDLDRLLTALRLIKEGDIKYGPIVAIVPFLFDEAYSILDRSSLGYKPFGNKFVLQQDDVDTLRSIWNMLKIPSVMSNRILDIGLRRLNFAVERNNPEDKLLDATIALEAFILHEISGPEERGELQHRLSVRVAHLLGKNPDEMKEIYKNIRKVYRLRSTVVHGGALNSDGMQYVGIAVELCRKTAQELISLAAQGKKPPWDDWLFE